MNLKCNVEIASGYKSGAQIARVISEHWGARELYCAACDSDHLVRSKANTPAVDFACPACDQAFQLKCCASWKPSTIPDGAYAAMIQAIRSDRVPNLLLMHYSHDWLVRNLMLVPGVFFVEGLIQKRAPLAAHARRAGWVGCKILLNQVPLDGRIEMVSAGVSAPKETVRRSFSRAGRVALIKPSLRGWALEVLNMIRQLGKPQFSLQELYELEPCLSKLYPDNKNVRPKIRQQLQVLRDLGFICFLERGRYSISSS